MSHNRFRRRAGSTLLAALLLLAPSGSTAWAWAGEPGGAGAVRVPPPSGRGSQVGSEMGREGPGRLATSSGWWLGTACVAAILAACGVVCLGARKRWSAGHAGGLRIVGRMSLSPRHSIVLIEAGSRTLMIGLGPQAAPALLGELPVSGSEPEPAAPAPRWTGLDLRLGDDE